MTHVYVIYYSYISEPEYELTEIYGSEEKAVAKSAEKLGQKDIYMSYVLKQEVKW